MTMFKTMSEVKAANAALGHHFFERDTMQGWGTRLETSLLPNQCFVTSESDWQDMFGGTAGRVYSVRQVQPDGRIRTYEHYLSDRQEALKLAKAHAAPAAVEVA